MTGWPYAQAFTRAPGAGEFRRSAVSNAGGSTRRWRKMRAEWAGRLPLPCRRCGRPVYPDLPGTPAGRRWHLGHAVDRALGGTDDDLWPEHWQCSTRAGRQLAVRLRSQRRTVRRARRAVLPSRPGPSREW